MPENPGKLWYYRHNINEYDLQTKGLRLLEHGAYRRLRDAYMANRGPLPADEFRLFVATGAVMPEEQDAVRKMVARFFVRDGDVLRHAYCDEEVARVLKESAAQSARAVKRWGSSPAGAMAPPPANPPAYAGEHAGDMPAMNKEQEKQEQKPPQPPKAPPTAVGEEKYTPGFERFWKAYEVKRKGSKFDAQKIWTRLKLEDHADKLIADVQNRIEHDRQWLDGYSPHAATYLNKRGWTAEVSTEGAKRNGRADRSDTERGNSDIAKKWAGGDVFDAGDFIDAGGE